MWLGSEQQQPTYKQQADSGYILMVEPTGFAYKLDMECKRVVAKEDTEILHLSSWKNRIAINEFRRL